MLCGPKCIYTIGSKGHYALVNTKGRFLNLAKIQVRNVGTDTIITHNGRMIHANALEVHYNEQIIPLPMVAPNQLEIDYARRAGFGSYDIPISQYVKYIGPENDFRNANEKNLIINRYRKFIQAHPNSLVDILLQYRENYPIKQSHRYALHEIQTRAGSLFLTDIEVDKQQSAEDFINQTLDLRDEFPDFIVRPTLDMVMRPKELFQEKVNLLVKYKIPSFNVRFRGLKRAFKNWIVLSEAIGGKNIWCNVVGITRRWYGKKKISMTASLFQLGVHTVSIGNMKAAGGFKVQPFLVDNSTMFFNQAPKNITYPESRADSIFVHQRHLSNGRRYIINGNFYSNFVKSKPGMNQMLNFIQLLS